MRLLFSHQWPGSLVQARGWAGSIIVAISLAHGQTQTVQALEAVVYEKVTYDYHFQGTLKNLPR